MFHKLSLHREQTNDLNLAQMKLKKGFNYRAIVGYRGLLLPFNNLTTVNFCPSLSPSCIGKLWHSSNIFSALHNRRHCGLPVVPGPATVEKHDSQRQHPRWVSVGGTVVGTVVFMWAIYLSQLTGFHSLPLSTVWFPYWTIAWSLLSCPPPPWRMISSDGNLGMSDQPVASHRRNFPENATNEQLWVLMGVSLTVCLWEL